MVTNVGKEEPIGFGRYQFSTVQAAADELVVFVRSFVHSNRGNRGKLLSGPRQTENPICGSLSSLLDLVYLLPQLEGNSTSEA